MNERVESPSQYSWIVYGVAMLVVGGLAGYILSNTGNQQTTVGSQQTTVVSQQSQSQSQSQSAVPITAPASSMQTFAEAVDAGNKLYDAQRYDAAIPYYQKALTFNANAIDVSTDLGTALWYTGRADAALAQYDQSLAQDRTHAQTLFNVGVVRADGKHDFAGAIDAWESLLRAHPDYASADKVRALIADARAKKN
jgi:tetratricopeptide (TPR) repeat protein